MICIIRIFLLLASASLINISFAASLSVVCTIKPACLLLEAVAGNTVTSTQLLPDNADLHHYSFRPSDLRKLSQADVIVRVSPMLEAFIEPLLDRSSQTLITLSETTELTRLAMPSKHSHQHKTVEHGSAHEHEQHQDHDEYEEATTDPHFWLDPQNGIKIAGHLAKALTKVNPAHATHYQQNSQILIGNIKQSDQRIHQLLINDKHKPYLSFHAGLQYFEKYYGLDAPEIISLHEGLPLGIKSIRHLRTLIKSTGMHCLINQPYASDALVRTLTEGMSIRINTLDPIGSTAPLKSLSGYTDLLEYIAQTLHSCLKNIHDK